MEIDFDEVSVRNLGKSYGPTLALARLNLDLSAGTVTLIQGANGSGKSTLLWLLALLARPTHGEIRYGPYGKSHATELRARIGLIAHHSQLYSGLTGRENLLLAARLHALPCAEQRVEGLGTALRLCEYWNRPMRTYSRGLAQRVSIARAMLHEPKLLLMDEPTTGLDAQSSQAMIELLAEHKQKGAIAVIVSHQHNFAPEVTDRILQLERGQLVQVESA